MRIKDFGGEFALIDDITRKAKDARVIVGVGDDCAVLDYGAGKYLLWGVDMLCEGDHFRNDWYTPRQIGAKAMESNVSDIAAMGGLPSGALISIALTAETTVEWVEEFYAGMYSVADKYKFDILGGDTTHSIIQTVSITVLGEVEPDNLCLRSGAKPGDLVCATGDLGKSKAGLELLLAKTEGDASGHLQPKCRLAEAQVIAPYANSMIDVSDGLASEVGHICRMSGVGAKIVEENIPISENTRKTAEKLGHNPIDYALHGGEDYELVFTLSSENLKKITLNCPLTVVGEITSKKDVLIESAAGLKPLKGGFNHFA
ncbi:MAG TPA: thiamine-phosphate kinase [Candidatus Altiarchaeales archaeon]|nr:thiamine-phosphate kinase [Candidatus Altiarchaeales archaeon]